MVQEASSAALGNLAAGGPVLADGIATAGGIAGLAARVGSASRAVRTAAQGALCQLAAHGSPVCQEAARAALLAALCQLPPNMWPEAPAPRPARQALFANEVAPLGASQAHNTMPASQPAAGAAKAPPAPPPARMCAAPGCTTAHRLRRCGSCGPDRYCTAHSHAHRLECRLNRRGPAAAAGVAVTCGGR